MDRPRQGWTPLSVACIVVSLLCLAPTAATLAYMIFAILFQVVVALFIAVESPQHTIAGFLYGTMITMVSGFALALPVSVLSVLMHPVGGLTAYVAVRHGAPGTGKALGIVHLLTFCLGALVLAGWIALIIVGQFA